MKLWMIADHVTPKISDGGVSYALDTMKTVHIAVYENHSQDTRFRPLGDTCQTVSATWGMGGNNQPLEVRGGENMSSTVRRLTPRECERLQGFPDDWTLIGDYVGTDGKSRKCSDSARYKALGNSIAIPCFDFVISRIREYLGDNPTLGSLFDGIGGFPLCAERNGITPVWASEIEEFPIAVTRLRFPEDIQE